jgi:hypothetical protein
MQAAINTAARFAVAAFRTLPDRKTGIHFS